MGPPPRSLAAEAHGCFMVRTPRGSNRIQGRGAMSRAQGGLPSVVLPSLVGNGKDPCMMTRLSGRHPYCDTQVTVWQRAGEGSPAVGFDCQRVAVWQAPINAGLRPPPSAADGIDRGLSDSRWLLIERRQGVADTRVHAASGRESHRSCRRGRGAVPYKNPLTPECPIQGDTRSERGLTSAMVSTVGKTCRAWDRWRR
jgi:hypothetical protein